jgi:hypothetical protein
MYSARFWAPAGEAMATAAASVAAASEMGLSDMVSGPRCVLGKVLLFSSAEKRAFSPEIDEALVGGTFYSTASD